MIDMGEVYYMLNYNNKCCNVMIPTHKNDTSIFFISMSVSNVWIYEDDAWDLNDEGIKDEKMVSANSDRKILDLDNKPMTKKRVITMFFRGRIYTEQR